MESVSKHSLVDVSGSLLGSCNLNQESYAAREDVAAIFETVTSNPEHVVIEKTAIIEKRMIVKEKVVLPKQIVDSNCSRVSDSVQVYPLCATDDAVCSNESLTDEMDAASQASLCSKMELGSQESTEIKMDISSQESVSSIMDALSQEESDEPTKNALPHCDANGVGEISLKDIDALQKNNLKRKHASLQDEEFSFDKLPNAHEASLLLRETAVAVREAAVISRERLVKNLEASRIYRDEYIDKKRKKKI